MATWDMWYIDEGFLIWIIPLTYQSRESIIWACTTSFVHTYIYHMFNVFIVFMCTYALDTIFCMFSDSVLSIYMYLLDFRFTVVHLISFMLLVIACTCMPESHHLIMYTCAWYARHLALSYVLAGLLSNNPGFWCPDPGAWTALILL